MGCLTEGVDHSHYKNQSNTLRLSFVKHTLRKVTTKTVKPSSCICSRLLTAVHITVFTSRRWLPTSLVVPQDVSNLITDELFRQAYEAVHRPPAVSEDDFEDHILPYLMRLALVSSGFRDQVVRNCGKMIRTLDKRIAENRERSEAFRKRHPRTY